MCAHCHCYRQCSYAEKIRDVAMKKNFEQYLIDKGYKELTEKGKPSTVYDYPKRIDKISKHYNKDVYSIEDSSELEKIIEELNKNGKNKELGNQSNRAVYSAMARYCEFWEWRKHTG